MTIQECYRDLGGDYAKTEKRLSNAGMIHRFLIRFPEDPTFSALCAAMDAGDREAAHTCAHALEGVCSNLGLAALLQSAIRLTAVLRAETESITEEAWALLEDVRRDHARTVDAIRSYQLSGEAQ